MTNEESSIHVLHEDGQQQVHSVAQVHDLLLKKIITREMLFWREGMADWRPLSEMPQPSGYAVVPPRRDFSEAPDMYSVPTFQPAEPMHETQPAAVLPTMPDVPASLPTPTPSPGVVPPRRDLSEAPDMYSVPTFQPAEPVHESPPAAVLPTIPDVPASLPVFPPPPTVESSFPPLPVAPSFPDTESDSSSSQRVRRKSNRHYFRTNPIPLTVSYLLVAVTGVVLGLLCAAASFAETHGSDGISALNQLFLGIGGIVVIGLYFLAAILFFIWVYITSSNCRIFTNSMRFSPGWAVGWFFIPFMNLFRPYQVMQEIWKISDTPRTWHSNNDSIFVGVWFVSRIAIGILMQLPFARTSADADADAQAAGHLTQLAIFEVGISAIMLLTIILVSTITWRQIRWVRGGDDAT